MRARKVEGERTKDEAKPLILVAVDDSDYARVVAKEASKIALERNADVTFLSVVSVPSWAAAEGEIDSGYLEDEEKKFQKVHKSLIDTYFESNSGILVESIILHGDSADKIVKYADDIDADLIVVGTRGQGRLASALLGSVSANVVHHSRRSVLIVKKAPEKTTG